MTDHPVSEQALERGHIAGFPATIPKMPLASQHPGEAVRMRELAALLLLVILGDLTLYRGTGFAGLAAFTLGAPLILLIGSPRRKLGASFWLLGGLILLVALRMAWLGSVSAVAIAVVLTLGYSLALQGTQPYLSAVFTRGMETTVAGGFAFAEYARSLRALAPRLPRIFWLNVLLPLAALGLFGTLFVLANPDLVTTLRQFAVSIANQLEAWVERFSSNSAEFVVWLVVAWIGAGLIRPLTMSVPSMRQQAQPPMIASEPLQDSRDISPYYVAVRNMLCGVIGLFAFYLVFEFVTLWFRKFPPGFYYAGYAHEGAAWLTLALGLATLVLSLIFRGSLLQHPQNGRLRALAWIWSAENLVLAMTVYNRMYIYIDFNGLTRMRMVGLFGISSVVVGFALVIWKIVHNRDFPWLIQRQLWTLACAVYLFVLAPIDIIVHSYNVRQVLAGDLAPVVQISVHPISAEGYLILQPLAECEDPIIRDGIRAMLAERYLQQQQLQGEREQLGWTTWQLSDNFVLRSLEATKTKWRPFLDDNRRDAALKVFRDYAYQWY